MKEAMVTLSALDRQELAETIVELIQTMEVRRAIVRVAMRCPNLVREY